MAKISVSKTTPKCPVLKIPPIRRLWKLGCELEGIAAKLHRIQDTIYYISIGAPNIGNPQMGAKSAQNCSRNLEYFVNIGKRRIITNIAGACTS